MSFTSDWRKWHCEFLQNREFATQLGDIDGLVFCDQLEPSNLHERYYERTRSASVASSCLSRWRTISCTVRIFSTEGGTAASFAVLWNFW